MEPKKKKSIDQGQALIAARKRLLGRTLPRAVVLVGTARARDRVHWDAGQAAWLLEGLRSRVRREGQYVWTSYDATSKDLDLDELCADLASPSLFAEQRFLCVLDGSSLIETSSKKRSDHSRPFERALLHWAATPALGHRVFLALPTITASSAFLEALQEKLGEGLLLLALRGLYDTPPPWNPDPMQTELMKFLIPFLRERKLILGPNTRLELGALISSDLSRLDGELDKLAQMADAEGRVPESEAKLSVTSSAMDAEAFGFADQVMRGDLRSSLKWLRDLTRRGAKRDDPKKQFSATQDLEDLSGFIVMALTREGRRMLAAAELRAQGLDFDAVAEMLAIPNVSVARDPFRARLMARDVQSYIEVLEAVRELELDLKQRSIDPEIAFERLLLRLPPRGTA